MRLYNIYYLCKLSYDALEKTAIISGSTSSEKIIANWNNTKQSYAILRQISSLKADVDNAYNSIPIFLVDDERPIISNSMASTFFGYHNFLKTKVCAIIDLYDSLNTGYSKEGVDMKIPPCDSFKEYIKYMKDIDFILSQCPLISNCDEEIVFNTVDVGSMWLSFIIKGAAGSHVIMNTLSKLSEIAIKYKSNFLVIKQQEEALKAMQRKTEVLDETIKIFKEMNQATLDQVLGELEQSCNVKIENPEDKDRTVRSIETMSILIDKGLEIYSSIETPSEIKVQFPFTENAPVIPEGLIKYIEEKETSKVSEQK